jgi:hypothetical protein
MREIRKSGSIRGCRKRTAMYRACVLLYWSPCKSIIRFLVEWKIPLLIVTRRSVLLWCASFWGRTLKDGHGGAVDRAWS